MRNSIFGKDHIKPVELNTQKTPPKGQYRSDHSKFFKAPERKPHRPIWHPESSHYIRKWGGSD